MTIKYKLAPPDDFTNKTTCVIRTDTDISDTLTAIPFVEDNRDYKEYLAWVAAGNTAEAAD
tara:strand:+ start:311 stop:493 length:183 start_codon:yes stop_codon:yes gene_type:complete